MMGNLRLSAEGDEFIVSRNGLNYVFSADVVLSAKIPIEEMGMAVNGWVFISERDFSCLNRIKESKQCGYSKCNEPLVIHGYSLSKKGLVISVSVLGKEIELMSMYEDGSFYNTLDAAFLREGGMNLDFFFKVRGTNRYDRALSQSLTEYDTDGGRNPLYNELWGKLVVDYLLLHRKEIEDKVAGGVE